MKINKTLDIMIASEIFLLAILEYVSWLVCNAENYNGEIKGSDYLIYQYPLFCTLGFFIVAIAKVFKTLRFNLCIYTIVVSWIFLAIQLINLSALIFRYGSEIYNDVIYPIFLFTIFGIIILKSIRCLSKRS